MPVVIALVGVNVWLAIQLWILIPRQDQKNWTAAATLFAVGSGVYVALVYGDEDLTPMGAISLGLIFLAASMLTRAWNQD